MGMYNDGFWGFPAVAAWEYKGSFWLKGNLNGDLSVTLRGNNSSNVFAQARREHCLEGGCLDAI